MWKINWRKSAASKRSKKGKHIIIHSMCFRKWTNDTERNNQATEERATSSNFCPLSEQPKQNSSRYSAHLFRISATVTQLRSLSWHRGTGGTRGLPHFPPGDQKTMSVSVSHRFTRSSFFHTTSPVELVTTFVTVSETFLSLCHCQCHTNWLKLSSIWGETEEEEEVREVCNAIAHHQMVAK